jgi:oxazoline/thiazoline dehydrogenase
MAESFLFSFKSSIFLSEESGNNFILKSPNFSFELKQVSPGLLAAIKILCTGGATEEYLSDLVLDTDGLLELPKFYYYLEQFMSFGWICHTVQADGLILATIVPLSTPYKLQFSEITSDQKYVLSRFAYCHKDDLNMVLESPLFPGKIILGDWRGAALIAELATAQDCCSLTKIPGVSEGLARCFLSLLFGAGFLDKISQIEAGGNVQKEKNETLTQWEFHDLLFHSRSRAGRHANTMGKSYRFLDKLDSLPVVKPKMSNDIIELYKPDLEKLKNLDVSFTKVIEERKSIRGYGENPITDRQLGEFLYRVARVREIFPKDYRECSNRPYPSGGASYELELYVTVNLCKNIFSGLYHYCPKDHQLCKISDKNSQVEALLKYAEQAMGQSSSPPILIIVSARFARVSWAYESIAYALILKHVGVLYQTMYLVATAMGLAPCAVGSGNSDLFAAAVGCDYYAESSVGEFILGS